MSNSYDLFAQHQQQSTQLQCLFKKASDIYARLEIPGDRRTIDMGLAKLASDAFKVLVLGEFKRGKSTFINAMLGQDVLPAFSIPCTAVINEIKWAENMKAMLHFVTPLPAEFPENLPAEIRDYCSEYCGRTIPPMSIPVEDIERYVVIPDPGKDQNESVAESPYSLVEIYWPLDLCRNGVEIIDSPGLNEHGTRTRVTTEYLSKVDAVIFVLSCQALASQSEMQVIETNIRGGGHEDIFFVCNRFDEVRANERDRIVSYGLSKLKDKTSFGSKGVYFLSALSALEGRLGGDESRVQQSGILPLENDLSFFLVNDRGRIKLLQPARDLRRLLNKFVFEYVPSQKKMLDTELAELEKQYEEIKPLLDTAERKRQQIKEKVLATRQRLKDGARREVASFVKDMAASIPSWLEDNNPKNKIKFLSLSTKKQAEELVKELTGFVSDRFEQEQAKWQREIFQPFVKGRVEEMGEGIRADIEDILHSVDSVKDHLCGVQNTGLKDSHPLERVLAAAGGLMVGGVGSALVGGMLGMKEMVVSLLPNIVLSVGMLLLGVTNPLVLIGALFAAGSLQGVLRVGSMTKEIRSKVAKELSSNLRNSAEETAETAANEVYERTEDLMNQIDEGLKKEIGEVRESVEAVLAAKRSGEAQTHKRAAQLDAIMKEVSALQSELDDIIFSVQSKA